MTAQCAEIISSLYAVALVIHDHAGTHVPVQYIQAYIQALLTLYYTVQLEHAHGDEDAQPVNFMDQTASLVYIVQ